MGGTVLPRLERLLQSCCENTGNDGAGVSIMTDDGTREPLYATDDVATRIERLQLTLGEGPCVDSSARRAPVLVSDLNDLSDAAVARWPIFGKEASRLGARAIFAFPIRIGSVGLGAVDLYRRSPGPMSRPELGHALTSVDGVGLALLEGRDGYGDPDAAMTTMVVHQAAGMVMGQLDTSIEEAMVRLRATAFAEGLTLDGLASDVVNRRRRLSKETR